jgi:alpha-ribazole phosphatase
MTERLVDLLRHGEVEGGQRFRGRLDDPLTPAGWEQLRAATADSGAAGGGEGAWDRILTSPLTRCLAFASELSERLRLPLQVVPDLRERDFGAWEGLSGDRIPMDDLCRFWSDPLAFDPPGAEPFRGFAERVARAWGEVCASDARHPLILTHGGVVRAVLGEVLGLDPAAWLLVEVPPACRTRLRLPGPGGRPSLVTHG